MVTVTLKTSAIRLAGVDLARVPVIGDHIEVERGDNSISVRVIGVLLIEHAEPVVLGVHVDLAEFK